MSAQVAPPPGRAPARRPYLVRETPVRWRIEPTGSMRVPGVVFASGRLLADAAEDKSLLQVANVATLPGIVVASYAMPDVHWGYGFPIGGVAGTDVEADGVVSPGGVGFDISCGVRLLVSEWEGRTNRGGPCTRRRVTRNRRLGLPPPQRNGSGRPDNTCLPGPDEQGGMTPTTW